MGTRTSTSSALPGANEVIKRARVETAGLIPFDAGRQRLGEDSIREWEDRHGAKFPPVFRQFVESRSGSGLVIGSLNFDRTGEYLRTLTDFNESPSSRGWPRWWRPDHHRPDRLVDVAGTDAYVLLADLESEAILAYSRDESWHVARRVATSVVQLVQGAGALFFWPDDWAWADVADEVGAEFREFWHEFAQGYA